MAKRVSLKDIAKEVGVSTALVSYVLNNLKEGRIRKEIAQKIKDVAASMNYRPNQIAKSLKTNRTYTVGLIVADISNPFSSSLARIVEDEANKMNYTVIFGSSDENSEKFDKLIDTFLNRQVDGLIISPPANTAIQIQQLIDHDIPFVLLDRYFPEITASYVILQNHKASYTAALHLIENGCRSIGMINYSTDLVHLHDRKQGYLDALKTSGIDENRSWIKYVDIANDPAEIGNAVQELLDLPEPVDAIIFASNLIAVNALQYINRLPLKVPRDLAVITFDETSALNLFYAPLTCIRQPLEEMGQLATRILLETIKDKTVLSQIEVSPELVIRASSQKSSDYGLER
jgi:LacI family transcriptional regulator